MSFTHTAAGTATEITRLRRDSAIGTEQRTYRLDPVHICEAGVLTSVVVVPGWKAVYVYPGSGEISSYDTVIAELPVGTDPDAAVSSLGYTVATG